MILKQIVERTLPNGLKVICLKKTGAPVVSVQLWYKTGSFCESDGIRGISHILEHMMFRGSSKFGPEEHSNRINDVGGHCNAFTTEDVTVFMDSVPRDYLEMVLEMEADRMQGLLLDKQVFETERKVIIEEYHTYMNNPVAKSMLEFRHEFFSNHPYATGPLGKIEDLKSLTVDDCRDYYRKWYSPDNAVLVLVGDFEQDSVFETVEKHFSDKKASGISTGNKDEIPVTQSSAPPWMKRQVDFDVPLIIIGYPAPSSSHEDAVALEILQLVISGGESSRLHREVVRKESVAVMAGGINHLLKRAGMSMFFAAFTPDIKPANVERSLQKQIHRIKTDGITTEEMEKVRNSTLTSRTFELYSAENICQRIGFSECIEGDYRLWVERMELLKNLNTERLVEVARKYWDDSRKRVLYLQPRRTNPLLYIGGIFRRLFRKHPGREED
ncbi:MAG: insulinase family protein [Fibrobacter sp.]|jgi:zinc protease|nr:insulinase family protein [Fibrobacter sp.]